MTTTEKGHKEEHKKRRKHGKADKIRRLTSRGVRSLVEMWLGDSLIPDSPESIRRLIDTYALWIEEKPPPNGMTQIEAMTLLNRYRRLVNNACSAKASRRRAKARMAMLEAVAEKARQEEVIAQHQQALLVASAFTPYPPADSSNATESSSTTPPPAPAVTSIAETTSGFVKMMDMIDQMEREGKVVHHRLGVLEHRFALAVEREAKVLRRLDAIERLLGITTAFPLLCPESVGDAGPSPTKVLDAVPDSTSLVSPVQARVFREIVETAAAVDRLHDTAPGDFRKQHDQGNTSNNSNRKKRKRRSASKHQIRKKKPHHITTTAATTSTTVSTTSFSGILGTSEEPPSWDRLMEDLVEPPVGVCGSGVVEEPSYLASGGFPEVAL